MKCISCGEESARKVIFLCPNCEREITRCDKCRHLSIEYKCNKCGYKGP